MVDCAGEANAGIQWTLCVLCQADLPQPLICPAQAKRKTGDGYVTLETDLLGFSTIGCLPRNINVDLLNNGTGIANTMRTNSGRWHKSCRDALNATKLSRAKKRKLNEELPNTSMLVDLDDVLPDVDLTSTSKVSTRSTFTLGQNLNNDPLCFFCNTEAQNELDGNGRLWQVRTFTVDARVRQCATILHDHDVLAKLSEGDMIATEARYHSRCLVSYYNRADRLIDTAHNANDNNVHGVVLAELIAYIEDMRSNQTIAPVFKLSELKKLYLSKLQTYGILSDSRVNSSSHCHGSCTVC